MYGLNKIAIATIASLIITVILGPIIIPILEKLKVGQSVRDDGPKTHLKKSGTPTMGGLIILIGLLIPILYVGIDFNILFLILITLGFGLVGFVDDYIIVVLERSLGLRAYQKIIGQFILALAFSLYIYISKGNTEVWLPFTDAYVDFGILFIPLLVVAIIATVNSANLTDGLDGLASGVTAIILFTFTLIAINKGMGSVALYAGALGGACVGFLKHNYFPAKIFMGDTGSMALGGAVVGVALLLDMVMLIPIVCGIYFIEALSVIIQVISYKTRKKRVFLMSPLHHHFEEKGWKEVKVVWVFWIATIILCIAGLLLV